MKRIGNWNKILGFLAAFVSTLISFLPSARSAVHGGGYTLEDYLSEVRENDPEFRSAKLASEGATLRTDEAELLTRPSFFTQATYSSDQRPTTAPTAQGTETRRKYLSLGVQENFDFGLSAKLAYELAEQTVIGASPLFWPIPTVHTGSPSIALNQSLWRNFFGNEVRAQKLASRSATEATQFGETFRMKTSLLEAELAYWRLVSARTTVRLQKSVLDRATKLSEWAEKRVKVNLSDQTDMLQTSAARELRELELEQAESEEQAARLAFNLLRGKDGGYAVSPNLKTISILALLEVPMPKRKIEREDVQAAQAAARAEYAQAALGRERNRPSVDLFFNYSLNSLQPDTSRAWSESFATDHPNYTVGVKFTAPLDVWTADKATRGNALAMESAELKKDRLVQQGQSDWETLEVRFRENRARLKSLMSLERLHAKKLQNEKNRLTKGRTTTYQVLQFEQDALSASLNRIHSEYELIRTIAQMKLYQ